MIKITERDREKMKNHDTEELIDRFKLYNGCEVEALIYDKSLEFSDCGKNRLAIGRVVITKNKLIYFDGYFKVDRKKILHLFLSFHLILKFKHRG